MGRLDGKVAIVTGSARGIGKAIALALAGEGANITLADVRTTEMNATAREIERLGSRALAVAADVAIKQDVVRMVGQAMDTFGRVDILVNNAGITRHAPLLELSEDDWRKVLDVNLTGFFFCTQAVATPMMKQKRGKIINMASVAGLGYGVSGANYHCAKAGVIALTKAVAKELGPFGINVNAIAPGMIETELTYERRTPEEAAQKIRYGAERAALGRIGKPRDVANAALFLAAEESSFITGRVIICDGGRFDGM